MKLGIFVNTDKNLDAVIGIAKAAVSKGHEVNIFGMDDGTKLFTRDSALMGLCSQKGINMAYCDHSLKHMGVDASGVPESVICGSQYNNAVMNHESDKVIIL
jgi:predicted peroxiredoxin